MRQLSMRHLKAASQGGFSRRLLEAGACEALQAALLMAASRGWGLRCVAGCATWTASRGWACERCCPRLRGRSCEALLAGRACGVCVCACLRLCIAFLVSSRVPAYRLRHSFLLTAPANCPLRWARVSCGVYPLLFHYLLLRRPALAVGAGSLTEFDHYLSIAWLLP